MQTSLFSSCDTRNISLSYVIWKSFIKKKINSLYNSIISYDGKLLNFILELWSAVVGNILQLQANLVL
jgi:hypothetical protein